MGVLEPLTEVLDPGVPGTPPDLNSLQSEDSSDDLFSESEVRQPQNTGDVNTFDLSFKDIIPLLPAKGEYDDVKTNWELQPPQKKKKNFCSRCFEEVKKDLKKLAKVIENYKNERDAVRAENVSLKREVEELKKIIKEKEEKEKEKEKVDVRVVIDNKNGTSVDASVKRKNFQNARNFFSKHVTEKDADEPTRTYGIGVNSFSVSLSNEQADPLTILQTDVQPRSKKSIADLRREFFAQEFRSEQKSFTARNFLEVEPVEKKKDTVRSRMTIKTEPKQRTIDVISQLTSNTWSSKLIPEVPSISLFQRFEQTRVVWRNDLEKNYS